MFTGRRFDSETGLYYYRFRYYSAELGRFLQTDPLSYYDSMNLYGYCWNNPLNWLDPYGLSKYWRWGWWDIITWYPHMFFDLGAGIGNAALKVPDVVRQPERIRRRRNQQLVGISQGDPIPTTAGPANAFGGWGQDAATVATAVPGTSLSGPVPTSGLGVMPGAAVGGAMQAATQPQKEK